jgi:hypothetical protein
MQKPRFTDRSGRAWTFRDYRVAESGLQPVDINHRSGEYRAFVAETEDTILVYRFGAWSYRTIEPNVLESQLLFARPVADAPVRARSAKSDCGKSGCLERRKPLRATPTEAP